MLFVRLLALRGVLDDHAQGREGVSQGIALGPILGRPRRRSLVEKSLCTLREFDDRRGTSDIAEEIEAEELVDEPEGLEPRAV